MAFIIQTEAADGLDVVSGKWSKQKTNVGYLFGHCGIAEDIAFNDVCTLGFGDISDAFGKDCIAVVGVAVTREKAYKSLEEFLLVLGKKVTGNDFSQKVRP